jgi:glycosyltransferase involved in cell wall biosynthesis
LGAVNFSLDLNLVKTLKTTLPLDIFVETGTFLGDTLDLIKDDFQEIFSVELSEELFSSAKIRFDGVAKIHLTLGDSSATLSEWTPKFIDKSVFYFLDAHWCNADNVTQTSISQCPLLNEIREIGQLNSKSLICIDDARLFLAPPPAPHESSEWPSFNEVLEALRSVSSIHYLMVLNDSIIFFPPSAAGVLNDYGQRFGVDWLSIMSKIRDYDNLRIQFENIAKQFPEKEEIIHELKTTYESTREQLELLGKESLQHINEKEAVILELKSAYDSTREQLELLGKESLQHINEKEAVILELKSAYENTREQLELLGKESLQHINEKEAVILELKTAYDSTKKQIELLEKENEEKTDTINALKKSQEDIKAKIEAAATKLQERDNTIKALSNICITTNISESTHTSSALLKSVEEKEAVIQELAKAVAAYRASFQILERLLYPVNQAKYALQQAKIKLREIFKPRLGNLYQYPPRKLSLPQTNKITPLSNTPKVSIVTPSFKQAGYIGRTIDSVLGQRYPNLEYFIQDGNSQDGTVEVLEKYDDLLSGWESKPDEGQSQAINLGFNKTTGDIMAWLNSDDLLLPGAIHTVIDYFNRHPDVDVVYGDRLLIDENDMEIGRWIMPGHDSEVLSWADYIPQETMFWRRRIWDKTGGQIDESFRFAMDWDLITRFREAGAKFAHIPSFIGAFRIHAHQKTSAVINEIGHREMDRIREKALNKIPHNIEVNKAIRSFLLKHILFDITYRVKKTYLK